VKPLQVVKEQRLIRKAKPMRETEEGRTDHHHGRANRAKRGGTRSAKWRRARSTERRRPSRTKTVVKSETAAREAKRMECESTLAKVVGRPKELFMAKALLMAESPEMTHSRMAKVAQSALEAAGMAAYAGSSYAMCPDLCGEARRDRKNDQGCGSLFHSFRPPEEASNPPKPQKSRESS
jgi:hypothetical protein